jgi:hypothetical protein
LLSKRFVILFGDGNFIFDARLYSAPSWCTTSFVNPSALYSAFSILIRLTIKTQGTYVFKDRLQNAYSAYFYAVLESFSFVLIFRSTLIDSQSPSILVRSRKSPGIHVGLRVVDVLFPVAKGQRELVIGDRQSGKSSIWLCSFVSQQSQNAFLIRRRKLASVGSMIGGRLSTTVRLSRTLSRVGARAFCALLVSGVTDSMGSQFLGNLSATASAEFLRNRGGH